MTLYCIYSNHRDLIEVKTLNIVRENKNYYIFDYDADLEIDQVRKNMMNKIWNFKHQTGSAIFTDEKYQLKSNMEIMTKKEILNIKSKQQELIEYKHKVKDFISRYGNIQ